MPYRTVLTLFLTFTIGLATNSSAKAASLSKAAQWLVNEQIAEACDGGPGNLNPADLSQADLDGDGQQDLIIDHGAIECAKTGRSLFCGFRACSVLFYLRRGTLLKREAEYLSLGYEIAKGHPPRIKMVSHDFTPYSLRWNGREFVVEK